MDRIIWVNAASIVILFGLSHYLWWNDFDINNPTDFKELSRKLVFARNTIALLGIQAMTRQSLAKKASQERLNQCYIDCFLAGLALGHLVTDAHSQTPTIGARFVGLGAE